ncbi:7030_t:CDS:2 [Ambispora gerdemannii]|uniref:Nucleolar protein 16 n=1 Tax=Ambispora gerdemannii TaxID=144530 RepID=A0A9N9GMW3_9GLOM|nr:7030_t:CDS:2 [Ambispora gerdemannii]
MPSLNGVKGGTEKLYPPDSSSQQEEEASTEQLKKTLGPNEGIIERDKDGNVINVIIGRTREEEEEEVFDREVEPIPAKTDVVRGMYIIVIDIKETVDFIYYEIPMLFPDVALEAQAANGYTRETHQADGELVFVRECIAKYGDNYEAMFRDIKLNTYQHTANQIRKKCERYLKSLSSSSSMSIS